MTPADAGDRTLVAALAQQMQQVTGNTVELAYVDQGYTGPNAAEAAEQHGIRLEVVKHPMAKRGFVLLPRRWVVERSFAWAARFRRLARDYERLDKLDASAGLELLGEVALLAEGNDVVVKGLKVAVGDDGDSEGGVFATGLGSAAGG